MPAPAAPADSPAGAAPRSQAAAEPQAAELAIRTLGLLEDLSRAFASPESTRRFVSGLMAKDEATGESYLRIPVKSEAVAAEALSLFGSLISALAKQGGGENGPAG